MKKASKDKGVRVGPVFLSAYFSLLSALLLTILKYYFSCFSSS